MVKPYLGNTGGGTMNENKGAYRLHIAPSHIDRVPEALEKKELIIGWSEAKGLLDETLVYKKFRQIIHDEYHDNEDNFRKSGYAASTMWRFIREMKEDDYVVVPHHDFYSNYFYIGTVEGKAKYNPEKVSDDTAYRRKAEWKNRGRSIPRSIASKGLQKLMNQRQTCLDASRFVDEIEDILRRLKEL